MFRLLKKSRSHQKNHMNQMIQWLLHILFKMEHVMKWLLLHPNQPPTLMENESSEPPRRLVTGITHTGHTDMVPQEQWFWWSGRVQIGVNQTVLMLCLPWLFVAVQYSAWWTLPCSERRRQKRNSMTRNWVEKKQRHEGKCVKFWLTQVVSFKFSIFCRKENKM